MTNPRNLIITLPNTNLRKRSKRVGLITNEVKKLVDTMQAALLDWEETREHEIGVALAAVQINELLRIVVIRNDYNNKSDKTFGVFINPVITKYEGEMEEDFEGCLSVKDIYGKVPRYTKVRVKFQDLNGKEIRIKAEGFLARTFQHEIDHTNGTVFVDHIKDSPEALFKLSNKGELEPLNVKSKTIASILR